MLFQTQSCGISLLKLWSWTCVHPLSTHLPLILSILKVYHWFIESLQVAQWLISCRRWLPLEIMLTMQEVLRCTLNSIDYWNYYYFYHYHCSLIEKIIWVIGALRRTDISTTCAEAIFRPATLDQKVTLKRASPQVVEMSVTNSSSLSQDSNHPDDLFQSRYVTPGLKPFSYYHCYHYYSYYYRSVTSMFLSYDSIFWPDFTHVKKRKEFIFVNIE